MSGAGANNTELLASTALDVASISFDGGSNVLSHYSTGTWTPELDATTSSPTVTYTSQSGVYTRIGNLVFVAWAITINTIAGGSGQARILNLPFTSSASGITIRNAFSTSRVDWPTSVTTVFQTIAANSTIIGLIGDIDNASGVSVDITGFAASDFLTGSIVYQV